VNEVARIVKARGRVPVIFIRLDSTGGSVSASLLIGRLLRKYDAIAAVEKNARCLSSCVYVLAGAPSRAVDGTVGIHRPFDPNDMVTSEIAQKEKYKQWGIEITAYLKEMNIPTRLYDDALFISPERKKVLSDDELHGYGLNENDPYEDEANAVKQAREHGISHAMLAARKARANIECDRFEVTDESSRDEDMSRMNCENAVLKGAR
jgi:hypothetical protein